MIQTLLSLGLKQLVVGVFATGLISLISLIIIVRLLANKKPNIFRYESERVYIDRQHGGKKVFPFVDVDKGPTNTTTSKYLSIIVPAYNEEQRLPVMLDEAIEYLESRSKTDSKFTYEIIVVDDGSTDKTTQVALDYADRYGSDKLRVLTLFKNRGKGGAVRLGVLSSRGERVLFADADGATKFSELAKLEATLNEANLAKRIVIGSRAHLEEDAIASRSAIRTFLMHGFHFIVWFFAVRTVRDTQCGFKLFGRKIANQLFTGLHVERWAFDVELLHVAEHLKLEIREVAVQWTEIDGSKIVPVFSWLQMGRDVFKVFFMYKTGAWQLPKF